MSTEALLPRVAPIFEVLTSSDGANMTEATVELMDLVRQWPGEMILLLAQVGALGVGGFQLDTRLLATILLVRMTFQPLDGLYMNATDPRPTSPFDVVGEAKRATAERAICQGLVDEMDTKMRKGLGMCAASWAKESAKRQRPCIHMPPVLLKLTQSERPFHRFTPYQILSQYPTLLVDSVSDASFTSEDLSQILRGGLNDPSVDVKIEAMKAISGAIRGGWSVIKQSGTKTQLILDSLTILPGLDISSLDSALEPIAELAYECPALFLPILDHVMPFLLHLIAPPRQGLPVHQYSPYPLSDLEFGDWVPVANQATEMILYIIENYPNEFEVPERKPYVQALVGSLLGHQICAFGEQFECTDWLDPAANLSEEDFDYPSYPEEAMTRLSEAIERETMVTALEGHIKPLVDCEDWRARYCLLRGLACLIQGSPQSLKEESDGWYLGTRALSKDPHLRVRYGWLQLIPVFVNNLEGTFQRRYLIEVVTTLAGMLSETLPRFKIATIEAIASMFQREDAQALLAFTPEHIMELNGRIVDTCGMSSDEMCEAMFSLFTHMSAAMGKRCRGVYKFWMDNLLGVAAFGGEGPSPLTRAAALETATLIGVALGKETFVSHATDLSQLLLLTQNDIKEKDDPRIPTLIDAWYNMSRILGPDFGPFLPLVVPPLLDAASVGFGISMKPVQDEEESGTPEATEEMESKSLALDSLALYSPLGEMFAPFLDRSMELALDALRPTYPICVIESAAALVPSLIHSAKKQNKLDPGSEDVNTVLDRLVDAMVHNTESSIMAILNKAFADTIRIIAHGPSQRVTRRYLETIVSEIRLCRQSRETRISERENYTKDDERFASYLDDEEGDILREIKVTLSTLTKFENEDEGVKKLISDVEAEVDMVLALSSDGGNHTG